MPNKSYLIGDVISNLYRYGMSSLQIVNEDITDKDWFIHFKVNKDHNIDIYRESIIYKDDTKEEIEDKFYWSVDSSELSYYISYLLSASLTGGLKEISDHSLDDSRELNDIVENMYLLILPKLAISNKEITEIFTSSETMLDIFNSKDGNITLPNYDFPELENLEIRINYIRDAYAKLLSGNLGMLNVNTENWLNLRSDKSIPPINTEKGKAR